LGAAFSRKGNQPHGYIRLEYRVPAIAHCAGTLVSIVGLQRHRIHAGRHDRRDLPGRIERRVTGRMDSSTSEELGQFGTYSTLAMATDMSRKRAERRSGALCFR
jgi:hypothetical protein